MDPAHLPPAHGNRSVSEFMDFACVRAVRACLLASRLFGIGILLGAAFCVKGSLFRPNLSLKTNERETRPPLLFFVSTVFRLLVVALLQYLDREVKAGAYEFPSDKDIVPSKEAALAALKEFSSSSSTSASSASASSSSSTVPSGSLAASFAAAATSN